MCSRERKGTFGAGLRPRAVRTGHQGSVVIPGEKIARIAGGGYFLRLSLPERHAAQINEGDDVFVGSRGVGSAAVISEGAKGKLVKVYRRN